MHCFESSTEKGSERAVLKNWQFGISSPPFLPLPHYLSYLTRLNNFGTGARFLYANEAAIHDLVRFHPPRASRLPSGSLASQKSSDSVRGSSVSSPHWLEAETF